LFGPDEKKKAGAGLGFQIQERLGFCI